MKIRASFAQDKSGTQDYVSRFCIHHNIWYICIDFMGDGCYNHRIGHLQKRESGG